MKIALVIFADFPEGSGPPRRIHMLGKGLARCGHEVHIIVPQRFHPGALYEEFDGLHVHWGSLTTYDAATRLSARLKARVAAFKLITRIASEGLDWLILSNPSLDGLPFLWSARRKGARIIATYDDLRARPEKPTMEDRIRLGWAKGADWLLPRLTHLNLATSSLLEGRLKSISPRTPIFIFPPIVDLDLFQRQPAKADEFRSRWGLDGELVISYLGTFWHVEGLSVLLQAVSKLADEGEKFKLVISGAAHQGLDCDDVSGLVREFNLQNTVIETGWLRTDDVVAGMSAADILVVPKKNDIANMAGMPAKLAEYLATGRAVVVSRVGDIPVYLKDQEDSLLCEPGNPDSLAGALRQLIRDASLRDRLAANARGTAFSHFDYRQIAARLEATMVEVAEKAS
jgi:glycosyltransferase involved in cell wall biosynthesis